MEFLRNVGETVNSAIDFVVEKNRKFTKTAKIKRLIKKESDSIIRSYITLGKHYYEDLRDVPDNAMKKICDSIDESKKEISKLKERLIQVNMQGNYSDYRNFVEDDLDFFEPTECSCTEESLGEFCHCDEDDKTSKDNCECEGNTQVGKECNCEDGEKNEDGSCNCDGKENKSTSHKNSKKN